jgi:hypothetical protein
MAKWAKITSHDTVVLKGILKGLSHEIDFENVDENDRSWP